MSGQPARFAVIGGGPAGAAAACRIARSGQDVTLWEKERYPRHRLSADLIGADAAGWLATLGVRPEEEGARLMRRLRLIGPRGQHVFPLRNRIWSLTRRTLDQAVLAAAERAGVDVLRGHHVRGEEDLACLQHETGAARVIVATGSSEGAGNRRLLKTYVRLRPSVREALSDEVELMAFEGGYACLQMVEHEMASLLLVFFGPGDDHGDGMMERALACSPYLARRLERAVPLLDQPMVRSAGDGTRMEETDRVRAGDALRGGCGLGFALWSGRVAARALLLHDQREGRDLLRRANRIRTSVTMFDRGMGQLGAASGAAHLFWPLFPAIVPAMLKLGLSLPSPGSDRQLSAG